jgi:hypothetical protein
MGAELFGTITLGKKAGSLDYSVYYGGYYNASNDGIAEGFKEEGIVFANPPGGKTPGFDLRWSTPLHGLKIGGSLMVYNAKGNLVNGTFIQSPTYWSANYAQYDYKRLSLAGQFSKSVEYDTATFTGSAPSVEAADNRAWFAMGSYRLTDKLQAGAYYTHNIDVSGGDNSDPANYFKDWAISSKYDFNTNFYAKLEGHFIDGNGVGFYGFNNPNGLKPRTNVLVAKIGFTF